MKKKLLFITLLVFAFNNPLLAQEDIFIFSWDIGFPTSDLSDFLTDEDVSLGGISMDFRHFVQDNVSIGGYFAWDFFNGASDGNEMASFPNADVTGLQRFYVNYLPIMVNSHYYVGESENIRTYVGAGLGAVRTLQRTSIGTFDIQNNNWHFGIYPEVGFIVPVSDIGAITLGAKYHVAFETDDSITYSYFSLNVGISRGFF